MVGLLVGSAIAQAVWYWGNGSSGVFVSMAQGTYTSFSPAAQYSLFEFDNKTIGLRKWLYVRHRAVGAACNNSGTFHQSVYDSISDGTPQIWIKAYGSSFPTEPCHYQFGQNQAGGVANLAAAAW